MDLQLIISIILIVLFLGMFLSFSFDITLTDTNGVTRQLSLQNTYDNAVSWTKNQFSVQK